MHIPCLYQRLQMAATLLFRRVAILVTDTFFFFVVVLSTACSPRVSILLPPPRTSTTFLAYHITIKPPTNLHLSSQLSLLSSIFFPTAVQPFCPHLLGLCVYATIGKTTSERLGVFALAALGVEERLFAVVISRQFSYYLNPLPPSYSSPSQNGALPSHISLPLRGLDLAVQAFT